MAEKNAAREKKESRFGLWLFFYAFLLLMVGGMLLFALNDYLTVYEDSQLKYALADYRDGWEQQLPEAAAQALNGLDPAVQSPEENRAWALERLQGAELSYVAAESSGERSVYRVKGADGSWLGTVVFGVTGHGRYGVPVWAPVEEHYDFSPFYETVQIVVPPDYTVFLGGRQLGPECVAESGLHYDALEDFYDLYQGLPTLLRYESMPFVGSPALRVFDENGRELQPEELNQERFLERCPAAEREAVEAFIPAFVHDYVFYTADVGKSAMNYYIRLMDKVVPGSQLATRINQAVGSFGYSNTKDLEILSVEIGTVTAMGGGRFLVDVHYTSRITALGGPVDVDDQARIILRDAGDELLAEALFHY